VLSLPTQGVAMSKTRLNSLRLSEAASVHDSDSSSVDREPMEASEATVAIVHTVLLRLPSGKIHRYEIDPKATPTVGRLCDAVAGKFGFRVRLNWHVPRDFYETDIVDV
jgi:hypothetical protein